MEGEKDGLPAEVRNRRTKVGGAEGIRTPDIHAASVALSQLSYSPTAFDIRIIL